MRIFILQDFRHALSGPLVEVLLPEVKLLGSIGQISLEPLIELLLPVKVDLHAVEFEDQSVRVAPPDQAERVASCRFKIDAHAQRSILDPSSVLGRALVLKTPLLLNERDTLLLVGLVIHGQAVHLGSLIEAIGLFEELNTILFRRYVQSFEELRHYCDTVSVQSSILVSVAAIDFHVKSLRWRHPQVAVFFTLSL